MPDRQVLLGSNRHIFDDFIVKLTAYQEGVEQNTTMRMISKNPILPWFVAMMLLTLGVSVTVLASVRNVATKQMVDQYYL